MADIDLAQKVDRLINRANDTQANIDRLTIILEKLAVEPAADVETDMQVYGFKVERMMADKTRLINQLTRLRTDEQARLDAMNAKIAAITTALA